MNKLTELIVADFADRIVKGRCADRDSALEHILSFLKLVQRLEQFDEPKAAPTFDSNQSAKLPCGCEAPPEMRAIARPLIALQHAIQASRPQAGFILVVGSAHDPHPTHTYSTLQDQDNISAILRQALAAIADDDGPLDIFGPGSHNHDQQPN
jgi:hypothetical protein